jgi:hypothetical protein
MLSYKLGCYWEILLPIIISIVTYTLLFDKLYNFTQQHTKKGGKIGGKIHVVNSLVLSLSFLVMGFFFSLLIGVIA